MELGRSYQPIESLWCFSIHLSLVGQAHRDRGVGVLPPAPGQLRQDRGSLARGVSFDHGARELHDSVAAYREAQVRWTNDHADPDDMPTSLL